MDPQHRTAPPVLGDRYDLEGPIGSGGVAEVWRARDRRLDREVAVKLLSGPAARDAEHRRRIEREARALAAISHPNVVAVYDYGEEPTLTEPIPYLVMELVAGPDLAARLEADGPLDPGEAVDLLQGILAGVEQAHDLGIVHGDLKPANVFLSPGGPKVGDFGVARILSEETGTTNVAATPTHAAPEVMRGERPTAASDVYAAGCILFEVLTGRPPFSGRDFWELQRLHLTEPPPSVRDLRPDVPEHLSAAVEAALRKDPAARSTSAAAFAALLVPEEAATEGPPAPDPLPVPPPPVPSEPAATLRLIDRSTEVLPRPPSRRDRVLAGLRRVPAGLAIGGLAVLLLVAHASAQVRVPEFMGATLADAEAEAARRGLQTEVVQVEREGEPGTIIGQDPAPGTRVGTGDTVRLEVTRGGVQIPDVVGLPTAEAERILTESGFETVNTYEFDQQTSPDHVIRTDPPSGSWLERGSRIDVVSAAAIEDNDGNDEDDEKGKDKEEEDEERKENDENQSEARKRLEELRDRMESRSGRGNGRGDD